MLTSISICAEPGFPKATEAGLQKNQGTQHLLEGYFGESIVANVANFLGSPDYC